MIDEKKLIEERPEYLNPNRLGHEEYNKGWNACNDMWFKLIKAQPKVGEWIPCSERLPEEDGEYLVWVRYEGREFTTTEEYEDGMWNYSGAYNFNDKVIAWMPLPKAYKEEVN